jgi:hypothetical protein
MAAHSLGAALDIVEADEKNLDNDKHSRAKRTLQEIWMAETKKDALVVFNFRRNCEPSQ